MSRAAYRPWDIAVTLVLAVPLLALTVRRLRALDNREIWSLVVLLALVVAELLFSD